MRQERIQAELTKLRKKGQKADTLQGGNKKNVNVDDVQLDAESVEGPLTGGDGTNKEQNDGSSKQTFITTSKNKN